MFSFVETKEKNLFYLLGHLYVYVTPDQGHEMFSEFLSTDFFFKCDEFLSTD